MTIMRQPKQFGETICRWSGPDANNVVTEWITLRATPVCRKCGQIDIRIPRMGIYHVCPPPTEISPEASGE
jgi:hypothetical protein